MIYEYQCGEHGRFERRFATIREAAANVDRADCPDCGQSSQRLLSACSARFEPGCGGFYRPSVSTQE